MTSIRVAISRILGFLRGRRLEDEFDDEVRTHIELLVERNLRRGMTPEEARRAALVTFGGVTQIKEGQRERRGLPFLETAARDVAYGGRMLRRSPGFTLVAVLTLALGIGVNVTMFSAFDAVAWRTLPVRNTDRLVRFERWFGSGARGNIQYFFSYPEYVYYRDRGDALSDLIAASWLIRVPAGRADSADVSGADQEWIHGQLVSGNYFSVLGVNALVGRTLGPADDRVPAVVLSYPFWQRRFNADAGAVGRIVKLNGVDFTIAGVAPREFIGTANPPQLPDVWAPLMMQRQLDPGYDWVTLAGERRLQLLGHRASGLTSAQAETRMTAVTAGLAEVYPARDKTLALTLEPATYFGETNDPRFQEFAAALMAVVATILLIACANLANMLLARSAARQKEIAIRMALGAGRLRLIRQLLTESLLLALMGGAAGLLLSLWGTRMLWVWIADGVQMFVGGDARFLIGLSLDAPIAIYTLLVSIAAGILFGLSPAWRASKGDINAVLKDEGTTSGQPRIRSRLRSALVAGQVAASMALLIVAGLLLRALLHARSTDPGFDMRPLYVVVFDRGPDPVEARRLQRQVVERLRATPEIASVTLLSRYPLLGTWTPPVIVDRGPRGGRITTRTLANTVSDGYFATIGIPIVRGRAFTQQEATTGAPVAVISAAAARRLWPNDDPLGGRLQLDMDFRGTLKAFDVIGVAGDVRSANLSRVDPSFVYIPTNSADAYNLLVRGHGDVQTMRRAIRGAMGSIDVKLLTRLRVENFENTPVRIQMLLPQTLGAFAAALAALALTLATIGIYGVVAYLANRRVREIGVRTALGARRADVLRLVLGEALRPVVGGIIAGLAVAVILSAMVRSTLAAPETPDFLFGVGAFDPLTFVGLSGLVVAVAGAAALLPAWRATEVDPLIALRHE
jgi:putative ABC transport system permease protein